MTTRAILLRAAALIEERGHAREAFEDARGRLCAIGAIFLAAGDQEETSALKQLRQTLGIGGISRWNQRSSARTVIAGLRKAADSAKGEEALGA